MQTKQRKYAALMAVANYLNRNRRLDFQPEFLFPAITCLGYINEDMKGVTKFIANRYEQFLGEDGTRNDGVTPKVLKSRFKQQLKYSVCFALARANALDDQPRS